MSSPALEPDHEARRAKVLARLAADGVVSLVVSNLVNVRYLTGFTGSNASLGLLPDRAFLVTDSRYVDQAAQQCPGLPLVIERGTTPAAVREVIAAGAEVVGVEADHLSLSGFQALLAQAGEDRFSATSGVVEGVRRAKDDYELHCLAEAGRLISEAVAALMPQIRVGMSERQVARILERLMIDLGADAVGFETIVATGINSAIPHHDPDDTPIQAGDLLKIDAGALFAGYHSDMTRTFVVGAEPTARQRELHDAVRAAAAAGRAAVAPGVPVQVADQAARAELARVGLAERFTHGLGHGVGLEIHEAPLLSATSADTMELGDVLTIEPGAYLPGFGGVRIEDTLTVDEALCLTTTARELIRLG